MDQADSTEVVDEVSADQAEAEAEQTEQAQDAATEPATDEAVSDEVIVTIGDESPAPEDEFDGKPAPAWVKELRRENKEKSRRLRELEQQLQQKSQPEAPTLPQKPTLESCDYDAERFEAQLETWHEKKRQVDELNRKAEAEKAEAAREWQAKLDNYAAQKAKLKIADFDDAEATVKSVLSPLQQSVIVSGAENAALIVAAIGKNESKAKELAAIKDPVKFAFAVAKLETQLKVTPKTTTPPPERVVRGNVPGAAAAVDSTLERLREEAARTGDFSKVMKYRQQLRQKQT